MTSMKTLMNDVHCDRWESPHLFTQRDASRLSFVLLFLPQKGGCVISEEKQVRY